jgi:DNA modification methylase
MPNTASTMKLKRLAIEKVIPYARNPRHNEAAVEKVAASIQEFGWKQPIVVDAGGVIVAGHTRYLAAKRLDLTQVPVIIADDLTPEQVRAYRLADNRTHEDSAWDEELLGLELQDLDMADFNLELTGFGDDEICQLLGQAVSRAGDGESADGAAAPAPPVDDKAVSKRGDVWQLGRHRLLCGDSTAPDQVARLLNGEQPALIVTDPPYCSGGFQEAGKRAGSVGARAGYRPIINDTLSTRGYVALLKSAFTALGAPFLYCFTDWRMWVHLYDVAESSGYGVRSMVVWDKGTPGMGRGWRAQHELILWGCRRVPPFDNHHSARGNVINESRTGNLHHTTEKPVPLIGLLLENTPFAETVADPFLGSGSTLIACERFERRGFGMELDPLFVDVAVRRWQNETGQNATLEGDGRAFETIAEARGREAA